MSTQLICDKGHHWKNAANGELFSGSTQFLCPVCGAPAQPANGDDMQTLLADRPPNAASTASTTSLPPAALELEATLPSHSPHAPVAAQPSTVASSITVETQEVRKASTPATVFPMVQGHEIL